MASKSKPHNAENIKVNHDQMKPLTGAQAAENIKVKGDHARPLTHDEVKDVSGGMRIVIKGPSWVNLMTYRKPGANAEPSREQSVYELYQALADQPAQDA